MHEYMLNLVPNYILSFLKQIGFVLMGLAFFIVFGGFIVLLIYWQTLQIIVGIVVILVACHTLGYTLYCLFND